MTDRIELAFSGPGRDSARSAPFVRRLAAGGVGVALAAAALTGCTKSPAAPATHTVTITASGSGSGSSSATSASASPTPTQPTTSMTKFSGTCYTLLSLYDVQRAIGHTISGKTAFVVGIPDKNVGRLTYLNCRYGVPTGQPATPQIEISVALYRTPAQAQKRITGTVQDYVANGATPTQVTVAGDPGTILSGGTGKGYTVPLLVASSGQRTVAVSVNQTGLSPARRNEILSKLGELALNNTAA